MSFVLRYTSIPSFFSISFYIWLGSGFKVFLPLHHLPIQLLLYIHCRKRKDAQGKRASLAIAFLKTFCPFWGLPQGWTQKKKLAHVIGWISSACDQLVDMRARCVSPSRDLFDATVCNHVGHDSAWRCPSLWRVTASVRFFEFGMCLAMLNCFKLLM